jgi:DNA replication protein DnaC
LKLPRLLKRLAGYHVLVLDDLGYVQQNREEMEVLFTLLAARLEGRVAPGVTSWGSHRSVLAQLRHTARQVRDSLRTVSPATADTATAAAAGTR